jgi:hypothetical protein
MPDINTGGMKIPTASSGSILAALFMGTRRRGPGNGVTSRSTDIRTQKEWWQNQEQLEYAKSQLRMQEHSHRASIDASTDVRRSDLRMQEKQQQHEHATAAAEQNLSHTQSLYEMLLDTGGSARAGQSSVSVPVKKQSENGATPDNANTNTAFVQDNQHPEPADIQGVDTNEEPAAVTTPTARDNMPDMPWLEGAGKKRNNTAKKLAPKKKDASGLASLERGRKEYNSTEKTSISEEPMGEATGLEMRKASDSLDPIASAKRNASTDFLNNILNKGPSAEAQTGSVEMPRRTSSKKSKGAINE